MRDVVIAAALALAGAVLGGCGVPAPWETITFAGMPAHVHVVQTLARAPILDETWTFSRASSTSTSP